MTKTEQKMFDSVKAANDAGNVSRSPVTRTKGEYTGRRAYTRYNSGPENKQEQAAFDRLLASGQIMALNSYSYAIPGHPILQAVAAGYDLPKQARDIERNRKALADSESEYFKMQAFIRKYTLGREY